MSEPGTARTELKRIAGHIIGNRNAGWFRLDFTVCDGAAGAWLAYGYAVFKAHAEPGTVRFALAFATGAILAGVLTGGHGRWQSWRGHLLGGLGAILLLMLAARGAALVSSITVTWPGSLWLACAVAAIGGVGRRLLGLHWPGPCGATLAESCRCAILLTAAFTLTMPFYTHRVLGAGDAHWYALMLSDFVEQVRLGQFPVWVGATEYAFNGTVSPLRFAPWWQHAAALLDLLTGRSLGYVPLRNALLAASFVATAFPTYFFLRAVLPPKPWSSCLLALVVLASPALLAPLYVGDQYMTFIAMPFLPAAAYGLWRTAERFDLAGHWALSIGVSGLWLSHPPIAFWTSIVLGAGYLVVWTHWRGWRQPRLITLSLLAFLLLGFYPIYSAFTLDNTNQAEVLGSAAAHEIRKAFPAILGSISSTVDQPSDYQPGYALLALTILALCAMPFHRRLPVVVLCGASLFVLCLFLPIPGFTHAFWTHMRGTVMQATNIWPMQRLVPIWAFLVVFAFAAGHAGNLAAPSRRWFWRLWGVAFCLSLAWSGREATRFLHRAYITTEQGTQTHTIQSKHNVLLTRYCFVSFAYTPAYYSHGYMDPVLEHRLLRPDLSPLLSNAESAVRRGPRPAPDPDGSALLSAGTWRAVNDNNTDYYNLSPRLELPPHRHLALRLEPLEPGQPGWLQVLGQDVFREYILPDSGAGVDRRQPPRTFGTLPTSSRVISLYTRDKKEVPSYINIAPGRSAGRIDFDFARYELWSFTAADLPIEVKSWVPYRVIVNSPEPALLETPRLWQGGYRARVNGRTVPVERSPDNLAMFPVPAGHSDVTIKFVPTLGLELLYWACLLAWLVAGALGLAWLVRRPCESVLLSNGGTLPARRAGLPQ